MKRLLPPRGHRAFGKVVGAGPRVRGQVGGELHKGALDPELSRPRAAELGVPRCARGEAERAA